MMIQSRSSLTAYRPAISLAVLDDDPLAIQAICHNTAFLLPQSSILWSTTSSDAAVQHCLHKKTAPDILLLDLSLANGAAIMTCHRIHRRTDNIGIIGLTTFNPNLYRRDIVSAGVQALISKTRFNQLIEPAVIQVSQGSTFDPENLGLSNAETAHKQVACNTCTWQMLSARELEILRLFSRGLTAHDIANRLAISRNTVYAHTSRAIHKLHARTRAEALSICYRYGTL